MRHTGSLQAKGRMRGPSVVQLQITDPRNLVTQYPRNGLGDATQLISPDTGTATHT